MHAQHDKQYPGGINRKNEGSTKVRRQEPDRKSSSSQQPTVLRSELFYHSSWGEGEGTSKQGKPNFSNPVLPRLKPPPYPFQVVARRLVFSALLLLAAHCPLLDICHFPSTVDPKQCGDWGADPHTVENPHTILVSLLHLGLVESTDAKAGDTEGQLYLLKKMHG